MCVCGYEKMLVLFIDIYCSSMTDKSRSRQSDEAKYQAEKLGAQRAGHAAVAILSVS